MARKMRGKTNGSEGQQSDPRVTKKHNVKARSEAIGNALEELYKLDCEIAAALARHVDGLRDEKRSVKKELRDDYQLTTKLVNARYGIYKAEREAIDNKDDTTLDVLRELFKAAPVGTQIDMLSGLKEGEAAESAAPA